MRGEGNEILREYIKPPANKTLSDVNYRVGPQLTVPVIKEDQVNPKVLTWGVWECRGISRTHLDSLLIYPVVHQQSLNIRPYIVT
ncbi:hypothetical protein E2C01_036065 [Portunus trituberculatus]|uniref:Uncharacterized protein n=1 Tax=Portunus trituberculatus TaxID=210409 RepID=A0A5B7F7N9_PORTR|nr:hypothetical protein [Portunus trituberculatus]